MKPAAFVSNGPSLQHEIPILRALDAKVFARKDAIEALILAGIRAQPLDDPIGISRIFNFGHKEIHLFGFDLCVPESEGQRVCFENQIFHTTQDRALHAQMLLRACVEITARGADIQVHGEGMFQAMSKALLRNATERVLTAVYDMQVCPPTYEVFSFFSQAEKHRVEHGYTAIDVAFLPGPMHGFRDDALPPSIPERESMLHRICVSGARLLPSVRNVHVLTTRNEVSGNVFPTDWTNERPRFLYGPRFQKNAYQCLEATQAARDEVKRRFPVPYTTITLREAEYWPKRNSNRAAWSEAARWFRWKGLPAIIVPDTHGQNLGVGDEFAPAAFDVDIRLALYEGAQLNLGVINGPMVLPMFAAKAPPYLVFQKPDEESPGTQEEFMASHGIERGDNYTKNGLTVWQDDTPENVMKAIKGWFMQEQAA